MTSNFSPADVDASDADEDRRRRNRKKKAILAAGAVFGVGAVITLAAWNDSVFGWGEFGIGDSSWNIQGSNDGTSFDEYDQPDGAQINFVPTEALDGLMPGDTVTGSYWVRETGDNLDSTFTIVPTITAANTLADKLTVVVTDGATTVLNQRLNAGTASTVISLPKGTTKKLDYAVTLDSDANPNTIADDTVKQVWEMRATTS